MSSRRRRSSSSSSTSQPPTSRARSQAAQEDVFTSPHLASEIVNFALGRRQSDNANASHRIMYDAAVTSMTDQSMDPRPWIPYWENRLMSEVPAAERNPLFHQGAQNRVRRFDWGGFDTTHHPPPMQDEFPQHPINASERTQMDPDERERYEALEGAHSRAASRRRNEEHY